MDPTASSSQAYLDENEIPSAPRKPRLFIVHGNGEAFGGIRGSAWVFMVSDSYNIHLYWLYWNIYISIYIPIVLGWILMFGWLHDLSLVTHPCWCWCISSPGELQRTYPISYEVTRSITKYHEVWQSETFKHKRSCLHQLQHKLHPRTKPFTKNWRCILSASAAHGHVASGWRTPECSGSNGNSGGIRGRLVAIGIQGRVG